MRKAISKLCGLIRLVLWTGLVGGQQLRFEDVPPSGLSPSAVTSLPLDDVQRATLQEAITARDYPRAETLLAKGIERSPKSPDLLTVLGRLWASTTTPFAFTSKPSI